MPHYPASLATDFSGPSPLANTAEDLAILLEMEQGTVPGDPTSHAGLAEPKPNWPKRIVTCERLVGREPVTPVVAAAFRNAVARLGDVTGRPVEELSNGWLPAEVHEVWARIYAPEDTVRFERDWLRKRPDGIARGTWEWLDIGLRMSIDDYLAARQRRFAFVRQVDDLLADGAVLVTPVITIEGYPADGRLAGDAEPELPTGLYNTAPFNLTGHPALSLPATSTASGMPFGLQLVGPRLADRSLIELAARFEAAYPWPLSAPGYASLIDA
jgi:Asp-tRNA(Asn)/Glu-tRNA(Gln) amidotransferase A subunit family amidase